MPSKRRRSTRQENIDLIATSTGPRPFLLAHPTESSISQIAILCRGRNLTRRIADAVRCGKARTNLSSPCSGRQKQIPNGMTNKKTEALWLSDCDDMEREEGQADGYGVFGDGDWEVRELAGCGERAPQLVAEEGSGDGGDCAWKDSERG